jgi:hypothetical protein
LVESKVTVPQSMVVVASVPEGSIPVGSKLLGVYVNPVAGGGAQMFAEQLFVVQSPFTLQLFP